MQAFLPELSQYMVMSLRSPRLAKTLERKKKHRLRHAYLSGYGSILHRYGIYSIISATDHTISDGGFIISDGGYKITGENQEIDIGISMFVYRKKRLYESSRRTIIGIVDKQTR